MSLEEHANALLVLCRARGLKIATAESCTGGMIAAALTAIPGSSDVFERGFVTYSDRSKIELLGVPEDLLEAQGAVSAGTAAAMAAGALENSYADISVAVTGVAGPDGGTLEKPVGLVFIASIRRGEEPVCERCDFSGSRAEIREIAASAALALLLRQAEKR